MVRTIGVAVSVPEPWRSHIDAHRAASGDPLAMLSPAHVTLLGPTEVGASAEVMEMIEDHLGAVAAAHRRFTLHLRGTGTFRPLTQVVFVAIVAGVRECQELASAVRSGPLARELPYPYHPHITVAHDVAAEALDTVFDELAGLEARFPVDRFTLHQHGPDGRWQPLREFELAA